MADYRLEHPELNGSNFDLPGYNDAFNTFVQQLGNSHSDSYGARKNIISHFDSAIDQFKSLYKNSVGRDATLDEVNRYVKEKLGDVVSAGRADLSTLDPVGAQGLRNSIQQYIGDNFQEAANQTAVDKTTALQGQYGSLADQFTEMGKKSLSGLSDSLQKFSTSLFEKLRPQLNLAAQAGGYADSGGQTLQEQGALKDLATNNEATLGQAGYDIENQANNIRMQGASGPLSLSSSFAANQPNYLANTASLAGSNVQDYYSKMIDQQNKLALLGAQYKLAENYQENTRPSFGYNLGQNFGSSFGQEAGKSAAGYGNTGAQAGGKSLLALL